MQICIQYIHFVFTFENIQIWECYYSNGNLPSERKKGSFWWRDTLKLLDSFKVMSVANLLDGASCLLWMTSGMILFQNLLIQNFFHLQEFTTFQILKAKEAAGPHDLFHLPISLVAYQQLLQLVHSLDSIPESQELDFWSYIWGTPLYSSAKAYKHLTGHQAIVGLILPSNGSGLQIARTNIKCSFGSSLWTDSALETSFRDAIWPFPPTIVCAVKLGFWKRWFNSFVHNLPAHSQLLAGQPFHSKFGLMMIPS